MTKDVNYKKRPREPETVDTELVETYEGLAINSKKRQREPRTVDAELVQIYENLASESEETRLETAKDLLTKLPFLTGEERYKVLRRLFRGLCSGRKAARLGFSVALTEVLIQLARSSDRAVDKENLAFLMALEGETVIPSGLSTHEQRDYYLGRVFGAEAIIKSGVLFAVGSDVAQWEHAIQTICEIAKKKSKLREECGWVLHESIKLLLAQTHGQEYTEILLRKLCVNGLEEMPEGLAIWITASESFPGLQKPKKVWRHGDPLSRREINKVANILTERYIQDGLDKNFSVTPKGGWNAKLHFAWHVVFTRLLELEPPDSEEKPKRFTFSELWNEAVDKMLFAGKSSDEHKYWGFMLFQHYAQKVSLSLLPDLFIGNFLRCLVNQLASSERYLHRAAEKSVEALDSRTKQEPAATSLLISEIVGSHGYADFDIITKTKTIEKLLARTDSSRLRKLVFNFTRIIANIGTTDEKTANHKRQALATHLVTILKLRVKKENSDITVLDSDGCIEDILKFLVEIVYYKLADGSDKLLANYKPPLSQASREMFRQKLMSCLTLLMGKERDRAAYPFFVVSCLQEDKKRAKKSLPAYQFDENVAGDVAKAVTTLNKIRKKAVKSEEGEATKDYLNALCLLLSLTLLQVYNGETEAVGLLDDIQLCYKGFIEQGTDSENADASELLIEVLLSLVSKPSLLSRRLAEQVFSACTSTVTANGLSALTKVLQTSESNAGQAEMFEEVDDEASSSGDNGVEEMGVDSDASDVSMISADSGKSGASESASEEGDASDETDEELAAFDAKLAQALGTRRGDEDLIASDGDESSDEDMNDEQMEALDEHLEKIFLEKKKLKSKKNDKKDAKETVLAFKARVLELLEIYIKQQHRNPLNLDLILPLLQLIRTTSGKQISDKACALVRKFLKLYKLQNDSSELADLNGPSKLLEKIHALACHEGSNAYGTACSNASILVCKVLLSAGGNVRTVAQAYAKTQEKFLGDPKCKVRPAFFSDWLNWSASARGTLCKWAVIEDS